MGAETGACGVRKVGAASNGDSTVREPNGGLMLPEELRPAPGEGVYSGLIIKRQAPLENPDKKREETGSSCARVCLWGMCSGLSHEKK